MATENEILRELKEQAPDLARLLNNTSKKGPYEVPAGYFDNIKVPDLSMRELPQAPVRSIRFNIRVFKYAVAAAIAGVIAFTAWFTMQPEPTKTNITLATTDTSSAALADNSLQNISDNEMQTYLEGSLTLLSYEPANLAVDSEEQAFTLLLSEVPDIELETFLN